MLRCRRRMDGSVETPVATLLSEYRELRQARATQGAIGFSGARLFRVHGTAGDFALKIWPASTSRVFLEHVHSLMAAATRAGLGFVPRVLADQKGAAIID